jgi:hypothetical protein
LDFALLMFRKRHKRKLFVVLPIYIRNSSIRIKTIIRPGLLKIINYATNPANLEAFRMIPLKNRNQLQNVENRIFLHMEGLYLIKKREKELKVLFKFPFKLP